jgi:hypothetical protein
MGEIFDVTRGEKVNAESTVFLHNKRIKFAFLLHNRYLKHYGVGQTYHNFVGIDASRAFITGEFNSESSKSSALDHVLSLSPR